MKKWLFVMSVGCFLFLKEGNCHSAEFDNLPKITVKGEASIFKPADQMEVSLGVFTSAEDSSKAVEINNQRIKQIILNLKTLGLDETEYQTGQFHVKPIYQKPSKDSDQSEQRKVTQYEAVNTIQVKTQKISLASQILNAAVQGGANQITQVNFNLNNPQAYRGEAIKLAAQNALSDANAAAAATEVKLKRILNVAVDHWDNTPTPYLFQARKEGLQLGMANEQVFEPGQTEIHAVVNVMLEIGA